MLKLEADHRRHAEIENAIRDLKYGVGLNHMPSGRFAANGAWLAVQAMAHNLARWTARIGLGEQIVTTKTLRRRFFALAGRLTRSARRFTLHLPQRWPWETQFSRALARLRAIPLPARRPAADPTSPPTRASSVRDRLFPCPIPPSPSAQPLQAPIGALKSACRPPPTSHPTRIRAQTIASVTPSPPFQCPHALHPGPSVDSG